MKRWDLLLVVAVLCLTVAAGAVDWRLGLGFLGAALAGIWYWLAEEADDATD